MPCSCVGEEVLQAAGGDGGRCATLSEGSVGEIGAQACGKLGAVAKGKQMVRVADDFGRTAAVSGKNRDVGRHRFEQDHPERLVI